MFKELGLKLAVFETELQRRFEEFLYDEDGEVNIIAMIVILAIAIALAIVFRSSLKSLFDQIWGNINDDVSGALGNY